MRAKGRNECVRYEKFDEARKSGSLFRQNINNKDAERVCLAKFFYKGDGRRFNTNILTVRLLMEISKCIFKFKFDLIYT